MLLWEWCCCLPGAVFTSLSDMDIRSQKACEPQLYVVTADAKQTFYLNQQLLDIRISQWGFLPKHLRGVGPSFKPELLHLSEFSWKCGNPLSDGHSNSQSATFLFHHTLFLCLCGTTICIALHQEYWVMTFSQCRGLIMVHFFLSVFFPPWENIL